MTPAELLQYGRLAWTQPSVLRGELERRPALMLLVSNLIAQSISVALSPLLARIYTPEDFGVLGGMTALVMIGAPLISGRFELTIPRASDERTAWVDLNLTLLTIAGVSLCFAVLSRVGSQFAVGQADYFQEYWYFVPLGLGGVAIYNTLAMEASRRGALKPVARSKLVQAILGVSMQLALGWASVGKLGLLIGFLLNQTAGVIRLGRELVLNHPARGPVTWGELRAEAIRNRDFPLYSSWSAMLDAAARWGLQLVVCLLWNPAIGGYIFLADRIIGRPLALLSTSLLPVYVSDVSRALTADPTQIPHHFRKALKTQLAVSSAWTLLVVISAPWIMEPVFGPEWADSPPYVQLVALALAPDTVVHAVSHTLQLAGQQRIESILIVMRVVSVAIALVGGKAQGLSALTTLGVLAIVQLIFAIIVLARCATAVEEISRLPARGAALMNPEPT